MKYDIILYLSVLAIAVEANAVRGRNLLPVQCTAANDCKTDNCFCPSAYICSSAPASSGNYCERLKDASPIGSGKNNNDVKPPKVTGTGGGGVKGRPPKCFPGSSTIYLPNGKTKQLDQVDVGDLVASIDENGNFQYSPVIYIPHLKNDERNDFLKISCEGDGSKHIRATADHFLFISKSKNTEFNEAMTVPAAEVEVGSWLYTALPLGEEDSNEVPSVNKCKVSDVEFVTDDSGVYTAYTKNGRIVIDGIVASSYVGGEWFLGENHVGAHWLASIHRIVYEMGGAESLVFRYFIDSVKSDYVRPFFSW